jgi:hypothetical protein
MKDATSHHNDKYLIELFFLKSLIELVFTICKLKSNVHLPKRKEGDILPATVRCRGLRLL